MIKITKSQQGKAWTIITFVFLQKRCVFLNLNPRIVVSEEMHPYFNIYVFSIIDQFGFLQNRTTNNVNIIYNPMFFYFIFSN